LGNLGQFGAIWGNLGQIWANLDKFGQIFKQKYFKNHNIDPQVAINLIVNHVQNQLSQRGFKLRESLAVNLDTDQPLPDTLQVLPKTRSGANPTIIASTQLHWS
jgi:hypothetical protein